MAIRSHAVSSIVFVSISSITNTKVFTFIGVHLTTCRPTSTHISLEAIDTCDSFFALLGDDFWGEVKGEKDYSFEDRDLAEVITELSAPGSRVVSFGSGRTAWIMEAVKGGKDMFRSIDLLDYALTVPIVIGKEAQNNQLVLEL